MIASLIVSVALVAWFFAFFQVRQEKNKQYEDMERRSRLLAESLQESIEPILGKRPSKQLQRLVEKFGNRERLAGVAVYDAHESPLAITPSLSSLLPKPPAVVAKSVGHGTGLGEFRGINGIEMHLYALPLKKNEEAAGALVIVHDAAFIRIQLGHIWRRTFFRVLIQAILISLITLIMVRWSIKGPVGKMADWMKQLRAGEAVEFISLPKEDLLAPIVKEVGTFAQHLVRAKAAAEAEAKLRQAAESLWTPERLKEHIRGKFQGKPLFMISNREPYMHLHRGGKIECIVPAGGVVTALDPVMRSCGGTWIAHGSGDADWETADPQSRIRVPPEDPLYSLRRVALTKEEEDGYYYGFANEGIWPLCHIAHTRPEFRPEDWNYYQKVNQKFAQTVLEELEGIEEPCVLAQDYHFTLLPRLIKEKRPDAKIALFWHIPWPNPEAFGICPWQKELLYGMLGADLIGFHTQFYCNNFLETVDRTLECRTNWDRFSVTKEGRSTLVKAFPISVAFPDASLDLRPRNAPEEGRAGLLEDIGVKAKFLAVGVDRLDYTKGILERFKAIERFLEKHSQYQKQFVFVQLGAPTRTHIKRYNDFLAEVEAEADRVNWKFKTKEWRPIVFLKKHHSHREIQPYYQHADICLVPSLSDGMNLVAKEYVAAREDNGGVLILSRFAGASRELRDALIINPYDIDQVAEALRSALEMSPEERLSRMRRLRETVKENNIYRWAGNLITELTEVRLNQKPAAEVV